MNKEIWEINESIKDVIAKLAGVIKGTKEADQSSKESIDALIDVTRGLKKKNRDKEIINAIRGIPKTVFPKVQKVEVKNPVDSVEVKKPSWYKSFKLSKNLFDPLLEAIGSLANRVFNVNVENFPKSPKDYFPVRLTDGKFFLGLPGGGGGGPKNVGIIDKAPTDSIKNNSSFVLTYTGDDLTSVDMTIKGVTYRKTLTWTDSNLTAVSGWVEV